MIQIYHALFQSHLNYGLQVWGQNLPKNNRLQMLQKTALRLIAFSTPRTPSLPLFQQLNLFNINDLVFLSNIKNVFQTLRNESPVAVSDVLNLKYVSNTIVTRGKGAFKKYVRSNLAIFDPPPPPCSPLFVFGQPPPVRTLIFLF